MLLHCFIAPHPHPFQGTAHWMQRCPPPKSRAALHRAGCGDECWTTLDLANSALAGSGRLWRTGYPPPRRQRFGKEAPHLHHAANALAGWPPPPPRRQRFGGVGYPQPRQRRFGGEGCCRPESGLLHLTDPAGVSHTGKSDGTFFLLAMLCQSSRVPVFLPKGIGGCSCQNGNPTRRSALTSSTSSLLSSGLIGSKVNKT